MSIFQQLGSTVASSNIKATTATSEVSCSPDSYRDKLNMYFFWSKKKEGKKELSQNVSEKTKLFGNSIDNQAVKVSCKKNRFSQQFRTTMLQ